MSTEDARNAPVGPLQIGRIARPHGVRGWVRVSLYWSESDALTDSEKVSLCMPEQSPVWTRVEEARRVDRGVLLKLEGVADRAAAELLRGAIVSVPREELAPLDEGEFYLCDLMGAEVTVQGSRFGEVVEVRTHPTVDTIVVRTDEGTLVEQPLSAPWLANVDVQARRIELSSTDGVIV